MKRKLSGYFRLLQRHLICPLINPNLMDFVVSIRKIFRYYNNTFSNLKLYSRNNSLSYMIILKIMVFLICCGYKNGSSLCIYIVFLWGYAYVYGIMYSFMVPNIYSK